MGDQGGSEQSRSVAVQHVIQVEDFEPFIGSEAITRIQAKARTLQDIHVVNFNSTYYGGGVAEISSAPRR
jgi:trehalose synthase